MRQRYQYRFHAANWAAMTNIYWSMSTDPAIPPDVDPAVVAFHARRQFTACVLMHSCAFLPDSVSNTDIHDAFHPAF